MQIVKNEEAKEMLLFIEVCRFHNLHGMHFFYFFWCFFVNLFIVLDYYPSSVGSIDFGLGKVWKNCKAIEQFEFHKTKWQRRRRR